MLPQRSPEGSYQVPQASHKSPPPAPDHINKGGQTLCVPMEGNNQAKLTGGQEERVDLGLHGEIHRRESIQTPGTSMKPNPPVTQRPRNQCEPERRLEMEDGGQRKTEEG